MKISTISDTLGYTLDTYHMFNPADAIADEDWRDDTEIDFEAFRADLAAHQVEVLEQACAGAPMGIKFKLEGSYSPREYNFKTDNSELEISFNSKELMSYIQSNLDEFKQYLDDNFTSRSGFMSFVPDNWQEFSAELKTSDKVEKDRNWAIMLGWYMRRAILTEDEYLDNMYDRLHELAYNHAKNLAEVE